MKLFDWKNDPVVLPLNQAFPELNQVREFQSRQCIFSHDRKKIFAVAGKNYQPVPHRILIDTVEQALKGIDLTGYKRNIVTTNEGARMLAEYRLPQLKLEPQVGDVVHTALRITNSYDLSWKLDIRLAAHQLVCKNGMVVGREFGSVSAKHYKGVIGEDLKVITSSLSAMVGNLPKLGSRWELWGHTQVSEESVRARLEAAPWVPKKHAEYILAGKFPMSLWDLYSRFTYASTHMTSSINRQVELDDRVSALFYDEVEE
jgi:hypothetical protein